MFLGAARLVVFRALSTSGCPWTAAAACERVHTQSWGSWPRQLGELLFTVFGGGPCSFLLPFLYSEVLKGNLHMWKSQCTDGVTLCYSIHVYACVHINAHVCIHAHMCAEYTRANQYSSLFMKGLSSLFRALVRYPRPPASVIGPLLWPCDPEVDVSIEFNDSSGCVRV